MDPALEIIDSEYLFHNFPIPRTLTLGELAREIDGQYISDCLHHRDAENLVRQHHSTYFHTRNGNERGRSTESLKGLRELVDKVKSISTQLRSELRKTDKYVQNSKPQDKIPWTPLSVVEFVLSFMIMCSLIALSCAMITESLKSTGREVFDTWIVMLFWSIPIGFPFLIKWYGSTFTSDRGSRRFFSFILVIGFFITGTWFALFAYIYPGIATTDESPNVLQALSRHGLAWVLLTLQLFGESFLAAAAFTQLQRIYESHHPTTLSLNENYARRSSELDFVDKRLKLCINHLAELQRACDILATLEKPFCDSAVAILRRIRLLLNL